MSVLSGGRSALCEACSRRTLRSARKSLLTNWHLRYTQQAAWTRDLRAYLFAKAGLQTAQRVLEVGCGTGAILRELITPAALHGLDLEPAALTQCRIHAPAATLIRGDGLALPYRDASFDIVYCHYLLLWVHDPLQAVLEMKRTVKPGGHVLALAEPDYFARIDQPAALQTLGVWQREALHRQGADAGFGTRLAETMHQAGLRLIETGTIQSEVHEPSAEERAMEWAVLEADLADSVPAEAIQKLKRLDEAAWQQGTRVLHVPTYFGWGQRLE
jgi:ubiquinone/menaquinone biosynthesis C-methylase UbiE